jgi:glycosyltransferase involved in cell wall biosynthesis
MIDVTLLICTRDRAASLARTLRSITVAAAAASTSLEVVIVDNGSTDDTAVRLASWQAEQAVAVTIVDEPRAGLARARNAGLAQARGRIIAMTDDDCVLDPGFVPIVVARFAAAAGPTIIGGRILPGDAADLPVTIKTEDFAMVADPRTFPGAFVMGANLAFTRDVVDRIGDFDERFGAGGSFVAAEDTDFLFRALAGGIDVHYDPHFVVTHHHGRRSPAELRRLLAGYAFGDGALYAKHRRHPVIVATLAKDLSLGIADLWSRDRPFPDIRYFYAFRLRHLCRGFVAYHRRKGGLRAAQ